jgi:hypothetical protein
MDNYRVVHESEDELVIRGQRPWKYYILSKLRRFWQSVLAGIAENERRDNE